MAKLSSRDIHSGTATAIAEQIIQFRIPRALKLKEVVDSGERLSEYEVTYMLNLLKDIRKMKPFLEEHPEWTGVVDKLAVLYKDIAEEALENERKATEK